MIRFGNKEIKEIYLGSKKVVEVYMGTQKVFSDGSGGGGEIEPPLYKYPCTALSLDRQSITFTDKNNQTLKAIVEPSNCDEPIVWSPKESSVATVDDNGVVTPHNNGNAKVTVTCGKFKATCDVSVNVSAAKVPCTGISVSPWILKFDDLYHQPQRITATVSPEDCDEPIIWTTDNPDIAVVDKTGLVIPKGKGRCIITATCGKYKETCDAVVSFNTYVVECTDISLNAASVKVKEKKDVTLFANVQPIECNQPILWESSMPNVAEVKNGVVTPISSGNANIIVRCGNQMAVCSFVVEFPKEGTEGCQYFSPRITMDGVKARLEQDGYVEEFDVSYTPNTGHPDYIKSKEIIADDGERYYLSLVKRGSSLFAVDGYRPDSGAWTQDYGFAHVSLLGFTENGSLDCGVMNKNNTVNQKLIDMGLPLINQSFEGLNFHQVPQSKNTMDVGEYNDSWLGLNEMSADHMNIHFNGSKINRYYGGVTDMRYPNKNGINRSWLSTFVHEFGHTFGVFDEAPHLPSMYNYQRDRNKCLYLQPNDLKCIQDNILTDWGVFLVRVQDKDFNTPKTRSLYRPMVTNKINRQDSATMFFDYEEENIYEKADAIVECGLRYLERRSIDIGNGLTMEYNIYQMTDKNIIKGSIENDEVKVPISHDMNVRQGSRYRLMLDKYDNMPNSLVNPNLVITL